MSLFPFNNNNNSNSNTNQNNNTKSLSQLISPNTNKGHTIDYFFKGTKMSEQHGDATYMSIVSSPEFLYASFEELRLADYEKRTNGKIDKYKIINTSSKTGLFGNNDNNNMGGLFGNNDNNNNKGGLFGNNDNNNMGGLFGNNNKQVDGFNDINKQGQCLLVNNIQEGGLFTNNEELRNNNINNSNKKVIKCLHENNYIAFCLENSKNEGGLICYDCLYKYHNEHLNQCIPIKNNNFENYKKFYKQCINKYKKLLQNKFDKIISSLENYEKEEIDNITTLFEKVDLDFELPIEIPFIERFEIAINQKKISIVNNILYEGIYNCKLLNLFQNELKNIKFSKNNQNYFENIKLNSSINFDLLGIGITKIPEKEQNSIEVNIYEGSILLKTIKKFENYENLSLGIFDSNQLEIKENIEYSIEIKGISNLDYLDIEEPYNDKTKINVKSSNKETVLVCLIIN